MKLSVPFLPDQTYILFLKKRIQSIGSVYFSINTGPVLDARMRFQQTGTNTLAKGLKQLGPIKKYGLLNARFIHPEHYHDHTFLDKLLDDLNILVSDAGICGFVFSDAYLLTALAARKHKVTQSLEAVPGINCMIDSFEKMQSFMEIIKQAGFLMPKKIILDRSLNRNFPALEKITTRIRDSWPDMKIELLANEGCILHCPFKLAHDSQISFSNVRPGQNLTLITNQTLGCHAYFYSQPHTLFKSPFIRPEDIHAYTGMADSIKLCGRTLGLTFLTRLVDAYCKQAYPGNLLDLLDAANWLADLYHIDNKRLDPGFLNMVTHCNKACNTCDMCQKLFSTTTRKKSLKLRDYKDYL